METLLDYSFNGMARMDAKGRILSVNPILEDMLGKSKEELAGTYAVDVMKDIPAENLRQILEEGQEDYSLFMRLNGVRVRHAGPHRGGRARGGGYPHLATG